MLIASYNPTQMGDVLLTMVRPEAAAQATEQKGRIVRIFNAENNETLGFNFFDVSEILADLAVKGQVFLDQAQVETLNQALQTAGFEPELVFDDEPKFVVGYVAELTEHPDSDHLVICQVNLGNETVQIVTGAPNVNANDIVAVAKDGSELPGDVKIKKGVLRGVESCGMMCSCSELNIPLNRFPNQIEKGLMILPKEYEKNLGEDVVKVLELEEEIIDFEITSNRPDCLSIEGLGRETAISLGKEFKNPRKNLDTLNVETKDSLEGLKVDITAPDLCYRYMARMIKNVKIAPSPAWMTRRLEACGVRSINNIVDITNYVMLELGEPMHAFDINSIAGKHITVRRANANEKMTTLDEVERDLDENMLVIADDEKAIAIAGVMGGQNSEIEQDTNTVVFEAAVFNGGITGIWGCSAFSSLAAFILSISFISTANSSGSFCSRSSPKLTGGMLRLSSINRQASKGLNA